MKIVGVADSDSYLKWGAAVLDGTPDEWDKRLLVLVTPALPSDAQVRAALAGSRMSSAEAVELARLAELVATQQPDIVLLALTGPAVRVVIRAIVQAASVRPVFVSGMPGISFPATRRALLYRGQVDLLLVHSKRERLDFARVAEFLRIEQRFGLATMAFLSRTGGRSIDGDAIIFATQAKVPRTRADRLEVMSWLIETARRHPESRVVLKLRARRGEKQTHAERYPYDVLAAELGDLPANLSFQTGAMSHHLDSAAALVTVSSTAALEAAARGIPVLVLDDFGVSARLINLVFEGSGLLGNSGDLIAGRFALATEEWLDENYFHSPAEDDWLATAEKLAGARLSGPFPLRREARRASGGPLRQAWDRKKVLGSYDTSVSGRIALVVGTPLKWLYSTVRSLRRLRGRSKEALTPG